MRFLRETEEPEPLTEHPMKRTIQIAIACCAAAFIVVCWCTTETHTVRIKETRTYVKPKAPSGPEAFEPVNRY